MCVRQRSICNFPDFLPFVLLNGQPSAFLRATFRGRKASRKKLGLAKEVRGANTSPSVREHLPAPAPSRQAAGIPAGCCLLILPLRAEPCPFFFFRSGYVFWCSAPTASGGLIRLPSLLRRIEGAVINHPSCPLRGSTMAFFIPHFNSPDMYNNNQP